MSQTQFLTLVMTSACAILVPSTLALAGIVLSRKDVASLRAEMNRQFDGVDRRLGVLEHDYKEFYGMEQKLEGRVEELSKRVITSSTTKDANLPPSR